jgi:hypothetical protein
VSAASAGSPVTLHLMVLSELQDESLLRRGCILLHAALPAECHLSDQGLFTVAAAACHNWRCCPVNHAHTCHCFLLLAVPTAVACCKSLRVACKTPFSGISCRQVESFCSDDKLLPVLAAWTHHVLHHSDCSSYQGVPFDYASLQDLQQLQAAAAVQRLAGMTQAAVQQPAAAGAAESALLQEAMSNVSQSSQGAEQQQRQLTTAVAVLAAAAVSVAIAAAAYALGRSQAAQRAISATVHRTLDSSRGSALSAPQQAACIETGMLCPLQQTGVAPSRGSGCHHGCPSRVISIEARDAQPGSILEPLLWHSCRCALCLTTHLVIVLSCHTTQGLHF